jgi:DNA-binding MarR family transcriptional regulator
VAKTGHNRGSASTAFLLAQVGSHAAANFAERLSPHQLTPPHAGILRLIAQSPGLSQQELANRLRMHASRLVAFVDELENKRLLQRQNSTEDRRVYALHLTREGKAALELIGEVAKQHTKALCAALSEDERVLLADMLLRIARDQGLEAGVHPGFARLTGEVGGPTLKGLGSGRPRDGE